MAIGQVSSSNSMKKNYQNNKEERLRYFRQYRELNRDKINAKARELKLQRETFEIDKSMSKPWHDPESLFCSPMLEEIINKPLRKVKDC